ncbi:MULTISPECIES: hypothetical protein [Shewanella]|jgi:hypothetical protein|uniref:KfrA N-terminal DNA-binding domain-containing protein n=1 Tax=Shewanella psychromarinicola TaxID=2487742 RepID=A0A3N4EKN6_9GAMM|nr:hypothetical protein [Shewanella psychromarinicola]AZG36944.1 hypothetical protein EGC80_20120 [Shewanella psychromarinicola]MCL1082483.1 hypothetical protein [Shewanella psychromarinicola]RPA34800.1 hypothetical protein EGC77_03790 [Shewanella psychromarinicola]
MSPIEQVLAAAKSIANNGHTPSLALIKSRLGNRISMPILIQGLQQFKALPKSEWQHIAELTDMQSMADVPTDEQPDPIAQVTQQVIAMQQQINQLSQRVAELERQLANQVVQSNIINNKVDQ